MPYSYIINWVNWSMINYDNKNYHISLPTRNGLKQRLQRSSIEGLEIILLQPGLDTPPGDPESSSYQGALSRKLTLSPLILSPPYVIIYHSWYHCSLHPGATQAGLPTTSRPVHPYLFSNSHNLVALT